MDDELKQLLTRVCDRLEDFEKRLKSVEEKAHDQVTDEILRRRFFEHPPAERFPKQRWPHDLSTQVYC